MKKNDSSEFTNDIDHLYTRDELMAVTPNVPLLETLEKADGYPAMDKYYIQDPVYFENLNELYTEENLPLMRDYLIMQGIWEMADSWIGKVMCWSTSASPPFIMKTIPN